MAKKKVRRKPSRSESELERQFLTEWLSRYPKHRPATEYRFHPRRKFRFDFAWLTNKVAVEVQGMGPGHCSLKGMTQDYDKNIEALLLSWKIIYLTSTMINDKNIEETCTRIARVLKIDQPATTSYIPLRLRRS